MRTQLASLLRGCRAVFWREPWWAEFWSAATALAWSYLSYVSRLDLAQWPSMQVLTDVADGRAWHAIAMGLGVAQLLFLLLDQRWMRWGIAIAMCWFWGVLTLGVWAATPWAPGVAVYAGWCGTNVFSILRLIRHHGG